MAVLQPPVTEPASIGAPAKTAAATNAGGRTAAASIRRTAASAPLDAVLARAVATRANRGQSGDGLRLAPTAPHALVQREVVPGTVAVTNAVGTAIVANIEAGEKPFKPELGLGGCTWVLTSGHPHVGILADKNVVLDVTVTVPEGVNTPVFDEARLLTMFGVAETALTSDNYASLREYKAEQEIAKNNPNAAEAFRKWPLSKARQKIIDQSLPRAAEKVMWTTVGEVVAASAEKVARVELRQSRFSLQGDGDFYVVADRDMLVVNHGVDAIKAKIV
jgi:hypothetical protein